MKRTKIDWGAIDWYKRIYNHNLEIDRRKQIYVQNPHGVRILGNLTSISDTARFVEDLPLDCQRDYRIVEKVHKVFMSCDGANVNNIPR
jgi:hypothetical protein